MNRKSSKSTYSLQPEFPVTLIFLGLTAVIALLCSLLPSIAQTIFSTPTATYGSDPFNWKSLLDYTRVILHIFGSSDTTTIAETTTQQVPGFLLVDIAFILFMFPTIEERFGKVIALLMMLTATFITGITCACFSPIPVAGGAEIVYLATILNIKLSINKKKLPLSSVALALLVSARLGLSFNTFGLVPTIATLVGGICGSLFGFLSPEKPTKITTRSTNTTPKET